MFTSSIEMNWFIYLEYISFLVNDFDTMSSTKVFKHFDQKKPSSIDKRYIDSFIYTLFNTFRSMKNCLLILNTLTISYLSVSLSMYLRMLSRKSRVKNLTSIWTRAVVAKELKTLRKRYIALRAFIQLI